MDEIFNEKHELHTTMQFLYREKKTENNIEDFPYNLTFIYKYRSGKHFKIFVKWWLCAH